jgi:hypothetical protein
LLLGIPAARQHAAEKPAGFLSLQRGIFRSLSELN